MSAVVTPFEPRNASDHELTDYHQLVLETGKVDRPDEDPQPFDAVVSGLLTPLTGRGPTRFWAANRDGRLIGLASVGFPENENSGLVIASIRVHPSRRRGGVGTALLAATLPQVRRDNRRLVLGFGVTDGGAGATWAAGLGFRTVHRDVFQKLRLRECDPALWRLPAPPGFRLASWVGSAQPDLVDSFARARTAIHDAPRHDSSYTAPLWTAERVRLAEEDLLRRGIEHRVVVAVDEATNAVAGLTEVEIHPNRSYLGYQGDTAVLADFRGRGLGRFMKAAMVRWLTADKPEMTSVVTSTAADNTHMIRVNHQIGYTTTRRMLDVESDVDGLEVRLHGM
jgi:GNAT superfamily N-acetyltransferase